MSKKKVRNNLKYLAKEVILDIKNVSAYYKKENPFEVERAIYTLAENKAINFVEILFNQLTTKKDRAHIKPIVCDSESLCAVLLLHLPRVVKFIVYGMPRSEASLNLLKLVIISRFEFDNYNPAAIDDILNELEKDNLLAEVSPLEGLDLTCTYTLGVQVREMAFDLKLGSDVRGYTGHATPVIKELLKYLNNNKQLKLKKCKNISGGFSLTEELTEEKKTIIEVREQIMHWYSELTITKSFEYFQKMGSLALTAYKFDRVLLVGTELEHAYPLSSTEVKSFERGVKRIGGKEALCMFNNI